MGKIRYIYKNSFEPVNDLVSEYAPLTIRVKNYWNDLPEELITAPLVNAFKSRPDWENKLSIYNRVTIAAK